MKIAIVTNQKLIDQIKSKEEKKSESVEDIKDDNFKPSLSVLQEALKDFDNKISFFIPNINLLSELSESSSYDLILNATDKFTTKFQPAHYAAMLELSRIPYCGSPMDSISICKNKPLFKSLLKLNLIGTPRFQIIKIREGKIPPIQKNLKYPLILKYYHSGIHTGSIRDKIIMNIDELHENLNIHQKKKKNYFAIIEEYIYGRKIYLPIIGNELNNNIRFLPAIETLISKDDNLQAIISSDSNMQEKKFLEMTDPLIKHARKIAIKAYNFFNCRDYAMLVFILDKKTNNLLLHEINPLTSIYPNGKISKCAQHLGISYSEIINDIILTSLLRYEKKLKGKYGKRYKIIKRE